MSHSASSQSPVLQVSHLSFRMPERALFTDLSITIAAGVTLVCGGEGSGKTTLLRLLAAELAADAGDLRIGDVHHAEQADAYRQQCFRTNTASDAFEQTTPAQYFSSLHQQYPQFDSAYLEEVVAGLSLTPHMDKKLYMLSTGSKRKVWIAAAFASSAPVVLLDEPFVALDAASVGFVTRLLERTATHATRICVIANYTAPAGVPLAATIDLGE